MFAGSDKGLPLSNSNLEISADVVLYGMEYVSHVAFESLCKIHMNVNAIGVKSV